jgi:hypothetical protein
MEKFGESRIRKNEKCYISLDCTQIHSYAVLKQNIATLFDSKSFLKASLMIESVSLKI